jgi:hypothetical protein
MRKAIAASIFALIIFAAGAACAAPKVPSSELPGRERERFFDQPNPVPRIELRDGKSKPVIEPRKQTRPVKRKKCRGSKRC